MVCKSITESFTSFVLCFLNVLFIMQATLVLKKNITVFWSVVNFPDNFSLPETPGFLKLLWAPTPGPSLRLCPGDLTAPPDPQLARVMTFACWHDITINPTNFWWWRFEGGVTLSFHKQRGGINNFSAASRGIKNLTVLHPISTTHPCELKNDNSLTTDFMQLKKHQIFGPMIDFCQKIVPPMVLLIENFSNQGKDGKFFLWHCVILSSDIPTLWYCRINYNILQILKFINGSK